MVLGFLRSEAAKKVRDVEAEKKVRHVEAAKVMGASQGHDFP